MKLLAGICLMVFFAPIRGQEPDSDEFEQCNCDRRNYRPRCGYNGKTYWNPCMARCEDVEINYDGVCRGCHCPLIIQPVCGDDGVTYANSCEANCHGALVTHGSVCGKNCQCDDYEENEVCGTDGKTYRNQCVAKCNQAGWAHNGPCELEGLDCSHCSHNWVDQVCGINGRVYQNACFARCAHAIVDPHFKCLGRSRNTGLWHYH